MSNTQGQNQPIYNGQNPNTQNQIPQNVPYQNISGNPYDLVQPEVPQEQGFMPINIPNPLDAMKNLGNTAVGAGIQNATSGATDAVGGFLEKVIKFIAKMTGQADPTAKRPTSQVPQNTFQQQGTIPQANFQQPIPQYNIPNQNYPQEQNINQQVPNYNNFPQNQQYNNNPQNTIPTNNYVQTENINQQIPNYNNFGQNTVPQGNIQTGEPQNTQPPQNQTSQQ